MTTNDRHRVYKSLETDTEFKTRIRTKHPWFDTYRQGPALDDSAWESFQMQRRVVERSTETDPRVR